MAIVQNPFTGRTSGKFAGAVFSKQFGKNTMRSKPVEVANPKTTKQLTQRQRFSMMVVVGRLLLSFIRVSFKQISVGMSAFNSFVQQNIDLFIAGTYPNFTYDWTKLVVSKGTLTGLLSPFASVLPGLIVKISWTDNTGNGDALDTDYALLVLVNPTKMEVLTSTTNAQRGDEGWSFNVPASWAGDTVHCYAGAADVDFAKIADSAYAQSVIVVA